MRFNTYFQPQESVACREVLSCFTGHKRYGITPSPLTTTAHHHKVTRTYDSAQPAYPLLKIHVMISKVMCRLFHVMFYVYVLFAGDLLHAVLCVVCLYVSLTGDLLYAVL